MRYYLLRWIGSICYSLRVVVVVVVVYGTAFNFVYNIQNERRIRADKQVIFNCQIIGVCGFL